MLTIRLEQQRVLAEYVRKRFEDDMLVYLRKHYRLACGSLGEERTRLAIRDGIRRAESHGIDVARDVCLYIDVMFALGPDFDTDPRFAWAGKILASGESPSTRASNLLAAAEAAAERRSGE